MSGAFALSPLQIRAAAPSDAPTIASFNVAMARETEDRDLDAQVVLAGVHGLLRRPESGFYRIALSNERIIGALMVAPEWSDWRNGFFWWIHSVYIVPEHRRQGVFRRLFEHVRAEASGREDIRGLRLYVERENARAQSTYVALGMRETDYRMFELEFGRQSH